MRQKMVLLIMSVMLLTLTTYSSPIVVAIDAPDDDGTGINVSWDLEKSLGSVVTKIELYRLDGTEEGKVHETSELKGVYSDSGLKAKTSYAYRLIGFDEKENVIITSTSAKVVAKSQWFDSKKWNMLFVLLVFSSIIIYYIETAKRGKTIKIRKIPALESVDEAIGRATEMGKPILFVPGIMDIDDPQTVAGLIILGEVAHRSAQYDAQLNVPVCRSMVMSTGRESVRESYLKAGRPDAYKDNIVHYLTDDQFGYASGVNGIMMREKPAAVFMLGVFYAESLLMAEAGNAVGAIQIAGTAMPSQLPFFVASCDYTLIGEELFAASAYLSKEPQMLGTLKGQDIGKLIVMATLIIGAVLALFGVSVADWFTTN